MELDRLCRKDNSSQTSRRRLQVTSRYRDELLSKRASELCTVPLPGSGIETGFPFARAVCAFCACCSHFDYTVSTSAFA